MAYKLLKSANLSEDKQILVRATISGLTLAEVKKQIKAVFDRTASLAASQGVDNNMAVKVEPAYFSDDHTDEVYYNDSRFDREHSGRRRGRGRSSFRGSRGGSPNGVFPANG